MKKTLPPFLPNNWDAPQVNVVTQDDGSLLVDPNRESIPPYQTIVAMFKHTVSRFGKRTFMARREYDNGPWIELSYHHADQQSDSCAQWLIDQQYPPGSPILVLSENSLEHAVLILAGYKARMPLAPVSPNYSLLSQDGNKLKSIFAKVKPAIVFVQCLSRYQRALSFLDLTNTHVIYVDGNTNLQGYTPFSQLLDTKDKPADIAKRIAQIDPDETAKILFTSGSTGEPKGVINTHRNLAFTQSSLNTVIHVDAEKNPPILLDWMPWHHTYGGNQNIHRVIYNGGTLYIDDGKPVPGLFEKTLANLRTVPINSYTTVPAVYALLIDVMEKDPHLREQFFANLEWCSYGGSDMPQSTFDRFQALAIAQTGHRIAMINALGSTESSAVISFVHWPTERMGSVGLPIPGTTLKLVSVGNKFEMRVKGPQIMPGYLNDPQKNQTAFDDDGFFCTGDAVRWIDEQDLTKGLVFAGRVSEDFKLLNGTWVHTGALRVALLSALTPLVSDLVITGQDRDYLGILVWLNQPGVNAALQSPEDKQALTNLLDEKVQSYNQTQSGSSTKIKRLLILKEPPNADANEISDKRYINQSAVLERRADLVDQLYQEPLSDDVIETFR